MFTASLATVVAVLMDPHSSVTEVHRAPSLPARSRGPLAWRFKAGGAITAGAVQDAAGNVYFGSEDGDLYALSETGALRWKRSLGAPISAPPVLDASGHIYVGAENGRLAAYDSAGALRFHYDTGGVIDRAIYLDPKRSRLVLAAGKTLLALSIDGEVAFRHSAEQKIYSAPVVDDAGRVYFGSQDDHVYALTASGSLLWSYRTAGDVDGGLLYTSDNTVVAGSDDGFLYCLRRDGVLRWRTQLPAKARARFVVLAPDRILVPTLGPSPELITVRLRDGARLASFHGPASDSPETGFRSSPLVTAHRVFIGGHDDALHGFPRPESPAASVKQTRWTTHGDVDAAPLLLRSGAVGVGSRDGHFYVFQPEP